MWRSSPSAEWRTQVRSHTAWRAWSTNKVCWNMLGIRPNPPDNTQSALWWWYTLCVCAAQRCNRNGMCFLQHVWWCRTCSGTPKNPLHNPECFLPPCVRARSGRTFRTLVMLHNNRRGDAPLCTRITTRDDMACLRVRVRWMPLPVSKQIKNPDTVAAMSWADTISFVRKHNTSWWTLYRQRWYGGTHIKEFRKHDSVEQSLQSLLFSENITGTLHKCLYSEGKRKYKVWKYA